MSCAEPVLELPKPDGLALIKGQRYEHDISPCLPVHTLKVVVSLFAQPGKNNKSAKQKRQSVQEIIPNLDNLGVFV